MQHTNNYLRLERQISVTFRKTSDWNEIDAESIAFTVWQVVPLLFRKRKITQEWGFRKKSASAICPQTYQVSPIDRDSFSVRKDSNIVPVFWVEQK